MDDSGFLDRAYRWSLERSTWLERLLDPRGATGRPSFSESLIRASRRLGYAVIVEYKRCSPSRGPISFPDPEEYIRETSWGAAAYSVLVEPRWFCGSLELLPLFSQHRPVLAKDFIASRIQVEAYRRLGASAVLLIAEMLGSRLAGMCKAVEDAGLEALVEAGSLEEALRAARECPRAVLGVNSRNLRTLSVDFNGMLDAIRRLRAEVGDERVIVAESGVDSREKALAAAEAGADALLVGTAIMRDPRLLREILRLG
ncbi:MAG: indole-3-glycerol-phosphate synthase [Desulfurococcales archaeon]|nr:indole-3-glycerol-phosphate synthase [Desulfurococcales archaeon]